MMKRSALMILGVAALLPLSARADAPADATQAAQPSLAQLQKQLNAVLALDSVLLAQNPKALETLRAEAIKARCDSQTAAWIREFDQSDVKKANDEAEARSSGIWGKKTAELVADPAYARNIQTERAYLTGFLSEWDKTLSEADRARMKAIAGSPSELHPVSPKDEDYRVSIFERLERLRKSYFEEGHREYRMCGAGDKPDSREDKLWDPKCHHRTGLLTSVEYPVYHLVDTYLATDTLGEIMLKMTVRNTDSSGRAHETNVEIEVFPDSTSRDLLASDGFLVTGPDLTQAVRTAEVNPPRNAWELMSDYLVAKNAACVQKTRSLDVAGLVAAVTEGADVRAVPASSATTAAAPKAQDQRVAQ